MTNSRKQQIKDMVQSCLSIFYGPYILHSSRFECDEERRYAAHVGKDWSPRLLDGSVYFGSYCGP